MFSHLFVVELNTLLPYHIPITPMQTKVIRQTRRSSGLMDCISHRRAVISYPKTIVDNHIRAARTNMKHTIVKKILKIALSKKSSLIFHIISLLGKTFALVYYTRNRPFCIWYCRASLRWSSPSVPSESLFFLLLSVVFQYQTQRSSHILST